MKASIIVYTHNGEKNIFDVVASCCRYCPECEIIVVDDASTDGTNKELETLSFHHEFFYLRFEEYRGKNHAMVCGVEYARNEVILFVCANMSRFHKADFKKLLLPVIAGEVDIVFGYPLEAIIDFKTQPYSDFATGYVFLKQELEPILRDLEETLFGGGLLILLYYQALGKRMKSIVLDFEEMPNGKVEEKSVAISSGNHANTEVALTILSNIDLIMKRIQNKIRPSQGYSDFSIRSVQNQLNIRMKQHRKKCNVPAS